jgi:phosphatidylinositol dimannoside acyltransferase
VADPAVAPAAAADPEERETLRQRVAGFQYELMERVASTWPERAGRAMFDLYARVGYRVAPGARRTVARNYARVLGLPPDSDVVAAAVREGFDLYGRYWYDTFRLRVTPPEEITKRFVMENRGSIDRALEGGRGVIAALPHMGNWDAAGYYMAASGYPLVAVAEQLRPKRVFEQFLRHRRELGMQIVPLTNDSRVGVRLGELLFQNSVLALVADRDLGGRGVDVEMFGATRKMPVGPALLSIKTGAPLLSCPVFTTEDGWITYISEPLEVERTGDTRTDVTALTRALAASFERAIAAKPVDWHMFQDAWPDAPPPG